MIAALDVHYSSAGATAAAVLFNDWRSPAKVAHYVALHQGVAEYEPGRFYVRELSPLLAVIERIKEQTDTFIIDGYCHLSTDLAPGLGAYLSDALGTSICVVGVAKNRYRDSHHAVEVFRATSKRPLFVTSIGIRYDLAAQYVQSMAGAYRIPDMLKAVDRLSRTPITNEQQQ